MTIKTTGNINIKVWESCLRNYQRFKFSAVSTKYIDPETPYKILIPNNRKPEDKQPRIKYFKAASCDFIFLYLLLSKYTEQNSLTPNQVKCQKIIC